MEIKQFEDKGLSHFSYALLSESDHKMIVIDPARDPAPYLEWAKANGANISAVIETHPHADFVSSHLELHRKTGATIYCSAMTGADYPHHTYDDGDVLRFGDFELRAINTPGHSPDSICIVLKRDGKDHSLFSGDTLFIGDVGRPDLRENVGNMRAKREELATAMYHSTRDKLMKLADQVVVYPAHGAGSLCGKGMSSANSSTIGLEKASNPALQKMGEQEFVKMLLQDQPFIPKYFIHDVEMNKTGAADHDVSIGQVKKLESFPPSVSSLIVDTRPQSEFKKGHYKNAINIQDGGKFETWLGSIVGPKEEFYLIAKDSEALDRIIEKTAKIGYESLIKAAVADGTGGKVTTQQANVDHFQENLSEYTIVDIRNHGEVKEGKIFDQAISIPLPELRERAAEVPTGRPIMVHCAGGYRSAAGASIIQAAHPGQQVYDLSESISRFKA